MLNLIIDFCKYMLIHLVAIKFMRLNNKYFALTGFNCISVHSVIFDILPTVTTFFELGLNMLYIHFNIFGNYHEEI